MKKLFLFFAALTLSAGLWAQEPPLDMFKSQAKTNLESYSQDAFGHITQTEGYRQSWENDIQKSFQDLVSEYSNRIDQAENKEMIDAFLQEGKAQIDQKKAYWVQKITDLYFFAAEALGEVPYARDQANNEFIPDDVKESISQAYNTFYSALETVNTESDVTTLKEQTLGEISTLLNGAKQITLLAINVKTFPSKVTYDEGEFFVPDGLVITGLFEGSKTGDYAYNDATKGSFSFSPALDVALKTTDTEVTITYGGQSTTLDITVNAATPTGLPSVDDARCTMHSGKFMYKGQMLIRKGEKSYNAVGQEM